MTKAPSLYAGNLPPKSTSGGHGFEPLPPAYGELRYPDRNIAPTGRTMSACEALCWIGYRRAIPKDTYFGALSGAGASLTITELKAFLHSSVPDPKPPTDPMDEAESQLMATLRSGLLRAVSQRSGTAPIELPVSAFRFHVTVNARGCLEPDSSATPEDYRLAAQEPHYGELRFFTDEVVKNWPASGADLRPTLTTPSSKPPRPTDAAVAKFYREWRESMSKEHSTPTEKEIKAAFANGPHPGAVVTQMRAARDEYEAKQNPRGRPKKV